jgi:hypothetical protein
MSDRSQEVFLLLSEDFELPARDAERVRTGLESMRANWARRKACLT